MRVPSCLVLPTSSQIKRKSGVCCECGRAVNVAKSKKALRDDKDPWLAMLDQRNTPTESLGTSPAQRLMSRRTKTLLPTATNLLYPRVPENVGEKLKLERQKAKWYHDRSALSESQRSGWGCGVKFRTLRLYSKSKTLPLLSTELKCDLHSNYMEISKTAIIDFTIYQKPKQFYFIVKNQ